MLFFLMFRVHYINITLFSWRIVACSPLYLSLYVNNAPYLFSYHPHIWLGFGWAATARDMPSRQAL